ncbi:MAG: H-NS histone family protein [Giesbergeria sp.]|uniref:H-NS histone family protein n=1 Tax=Giesbergeria sp. TaxID=2818473 RepID=UPI0026195F97|nr:H-NS histone family protein [Giesbergeria sp.]MDD2610360.1 H-NS histone family protein [Giesbergeria sp.]
MSNYKELLKERELLEAKIEDARRAELTSALQTVRTLVSEYQLTQQQVFPPLRGTRSLVGSVGTVNKVAPKYRNPLTGQTWTGRGKAPKWIDGQDREQFLI